jgi:molybdopterin synthase catalytic subunit
MLFTISATPLDIEAAVREVSRPDCGGIATFVGTTRDHHAGRRVLYLEYDAYAPLAIRAFERIAAETVERWPDTSLAIHHRVGRVEIGETCVVIAAASPHRAGAFAAARYAIERVKQIAPIWKRERFEGGEEWIEGSTAHPDDEVARGRAVAASLGG